MKLSQLLKAWDILHVMDVGEIGFCDIDKALTQAGVIIENDCNPCQPILQREDSADKLGECPGGVYYMEHLDSETVRLIPRR